MRKRTGIAIKRGVRRVLWWAVVPAAVVGLRLGWGWEAHHRLAKEQAALRAQGVPVTEADLPDPAKVLPDQNAAVAFERALADLRLDNAEFQFVSLEKKQVDMDRVQFTPEETAALRRIGEANQAMIGDLDQSASRTNCMWSANLDIYLGPEATVSIGKPRMVASFLAEQALVEAGDGQGGEALAQLRRIMNVARIVNKQPMFISALVAGAIQSTAVTMVERLSPSLNWNDPAVVAQGRKLLGDIVAAQATDFYHAFLPEFAFDHYWIWKQTPPSNWWLTPLLEDEEARCLEPYAVNLPTLRAANYPEFKARLVAAPGVSKGHFNHVLTLFSGEAELAPNYCLVYFYRKSDVAAGALLLAARLYRHDHDAWPQSAAALVPDYLPSLPRDPFDPRGGPLRYRLDAQGPTVWSVGEDGVDNGAAAPAGNVNRYRHPDIIYGVAWRQFIESLPVP